MLGFLELVIRLTDLVDLRFFGSAEERRDHFPRALFFRRMIVWRLWQVAVIMGLG